MKQRVEEFEKVKKIIETAYVDGGIFNTRNVVGDEIETIFEGKFFTVDICDYYGYFEVFGMTNEEFDELRKFYYELGEKNGQRRSKKMDTIKFYERRLKEEENEK